MGHGKSRKAGNAPGATRPGKRSVRELKHEGSRLGGVIVKGVRVGLTGYGRHHVVAQGAGVDRRRIPALKTSRNRNHGVARCGRWRVALHNLEVAETRLPLGPRVHLIGIPLDCIWRVSAQRHNHIEPLGPVSTRSINAELGIRSPFNVHHKRLVAIGSRELGSVDAKHGGVGHGKVEKSVCHVGSSGQ